jgi:hypothetical protein
MRLESLVVSHVDLEVPYVSSPNESTFVPLPVRKDPKCENAFDKFLKDVFTGNAYANIREDIKKRYPTADYSDQIARSAAVITDSSFICNTRFIIDSYITGKANVYAMNYALFPEANASTHASDLLALFSNANKPKTDYRSLVRCIKNATEIPDEIQADAFAEYVQGVTAPILQQYFMDHAIWGDPNHNSGMLTWQLASNNNTCPDKKLGICVGNLMTITGSRDDNQGQDIQTPSAKCDFWSKIAQEIAKISGQDMREGLGGASEQTVLNEEL